MSSGTLRFMATHSMLKPTRKHPDDAGIDLCTAVDVVVKPNSTAIIPTGVYFDIPEGTMLMLKPKSRHDFLIGAGVIESGYQGEILVKIINTSNENIQFAAGDQIAQAVHLPVLCYGLEEAASLQDLFHVKSDRGATGGIVSQAGKRFGEV